MKTPTYEIPTEMREFAEKSVDQARKAFEGFMGAAQKAASQADSAASTVQANAKTIGVQAISYAEQNVSAAFELAQKLVRAKDLQEVLSLQSEFMKKQLTAIQDQAKDLGSIVQNAAQSAVNQTKPK